MFKSCKEKRYNAVSNKDENRDTIGFIRTDEASLRLAQIELNRMNARYERRERFKEGVCSILREIFYPPLSIFFHIISFVTRGIGCISSVGLIAGVYYAIQFVYEFKGGIGIGDSEFFGKAIFFIVLPFISFTVGVLSEKLSDYFEMNAI